MTRKEILDLLTFKMPSKYDRGIQASMIILIVFGTIMLLSATTGQATSDSMAVIKALIRQTGFVIVGYLALLFFAKTFTIKRARRFSAISVIVNLVMIGVCFFFKTDYGIPAWIPISLGPLSFTIQPSEFAKIVYIVYIAVSFGAISNKIHYSASDVYTWPGIYTAILIIAVMYQDDFGTLAVIVFSLAMTCLLLNQPFFKGFTKFLRYACIVGIVGVLFFSFSNIGLKLLSSVDAGAKIAKRVSIAQDPFANSLGSGWQIIHGLYAFANGSWFGVGLGNSTQKYGYLPTSSTDSILPIVVEETGILGFSLIAICYFVIIMRLIKYARAHHDLPSKMILMGVASYLFCHFLLNVGGVSALIPFTGVPLIFISNGGSSFITAMISLGVCQAIISDYNLNLNQRDDLN